MRAPKTLLVLSAPLALALSAGAQSFNLDVGQNTTHPLPSNAYGAAANQPGVWFSVRTNAQAAVALNDIQGNTTGVTITPAGGWGDFAISNPGWNGDDDALLEDASDVGSNSQMGAGSISWTIAGLTAGNYEVYTYAIAPDLPATYRTRTSVTGSPQGPQITTGAWSGSPHVLGVSYAFHTVQIGAGQNLTIVTDDPGPGGNLGTVNGFQIKLVSGGAVGQGFCYGDGTGTPCPCGNGSAFGANEGCLNSLGTGGKLGAAGNASLANDTIVLAGSQMPSSSALYFQGSGQQSGGAGATFGDGLRCAAGTIVRLGTKTNAAGASQYPEAGDQSVSVKGLVGFPGTREYQIWYRNAAAFCTASTFNLTNGWTLTWAP